jgi:hypothetical protein
MQHIGVIRCHMWCLCIVQCASLQGVRSAVCVPAHRGFDTTCRIVSLCTCALVCRPHGYDPPGQAINTTAAPYVPIVLSRGVVSVTAEDNAFNTQQWLAVALVLLLDAATLLLATALFLTPLEKMGKKVMKQSFDNR